MTEYFIFEKENKNFALPVTSVLEIVELDQIEDLGLDLYGCIGGIVNREKIVPVFDSVTLGLKNDLKTPSVTNIIIVLCDEVAFGLTMDDFIGVDTLPMHQDLNETNDDGIGNKIVSAVVGYQKSTLIIFSPENISKTVSAKLDEQTLKREKKELDVYSVESEIHKRATKQFLCFSIGNINLAIPIEQIREVIEEYEVTPIFNVHSLLRGLINLRGNVIACLDISNEIGLDQKPLTLTTKYLIISYQESTIALCADIVHGINNFYTDSIQKTESVLDERQQIFIQGIYEDSDKTFLLLSVVDIFETEYLLEYTEMANITQ